MFKMTVSSLLCHLILSARARPSISSKIVILLGFIRRLLMTKATPAEERGVSGSGDVIMVSLEL